MLIIYTKYNIMSSSYNKKLLILSKIVQSQRKGAFLQKSQKKRIYKFIFNFCSDF